MTQRPTVRFFSVSGDAVYHLSSSDHADDGFWTLHNIYHTLEMPSIEVPSGKKQKFICESLFVYVLLTDGQGEFNLGVVIEELDLAQPNRNRLFGRSQPVSLLMESPFDVYEEVFEFRNVPFPRPGQYSVRILENDQPFEGGEVVLRLIRGDEL